MWLDALPQNFTGIILANEVLDVIPVHLVTWRAGKALINDAYSLALMSGPIKLNFASLPSKLPCPIIKMKTKRLNNAMRELRILVAVRNEIKNP